MKILSFTIILLIFVAYGDNMLKVDSNGNPLLDQFSEDGFVDCVFRISNIKIIEDKYTFHLSAYYENNVLGINVEVFRNISGGFDSEMNLIKEHVYYDGVIFRRSGRESDLLIQVLAKLYGIESKSLKMVEEETFTAIALHSGNIKIENDAVKIKLFGNDSEEDHEDDYYESFFNIDMSNGLVFWNEKDIGYRKALIKSLSR